MTQKHRLLILLLLLISSAVAVRLLALSSKTSFTHDGGISYICATGHQIEYNQTVRNNEWPYGDWTAAADWKKFWQIEKRFCFRDIQSGLIHSDIHPPLYYWLLHVWVMIFGINVWSGPILNIIIDIACCAVLYRLARAVFDDRACALMAVFFWAMSPSVIETEMITRQYCLLVLFSLLFSQQVLRFSAGSVNWKQVLTIGLIAGCGVLTHYHFALIIVGSGIWLCFALRKNVARFFGWLLGLGLGAIVFLVINPGFIKPFNRIARGPVNFSWIEFKTRSIRVICSMLPYRTKDIISRINTDTWLPVIIFVMLTVVVITIAVWQLRKKNMRINTKLFENKFCYHVSMFMWLWIVSVSLYLTMKSPGHAMGGRYLAMVWPFFAIAVIGAVKGISRNGNKLLYVVCSLMTIAGFGFFGAELAYIKLRNLPETKEMLVNTKQVIIDNPARGVLPRIVHGLPDEIKVFASWQSDLIANTNRWLEELNENALYMTSTSYANSQHGQKKILELAEQKCEISKVSYRKWGFDRKFNVVADVYLLKARSRNTSEELHH
jgi:hypothetical protein